MGLINTDGNLIIKELSLITFKGPDNPGKMTYISREFPGVYKKIQSTETQDDFNLIVAVVARMAEQIQLVNAGSITLQRAEESIGELLAQIYVYPSLPKIE